MVEVPIADVRAGHGEIDEILKVIDAESMVSRPPHIESFPDRA